MARYVILRHEEPAPPAGRPAVLAIRDGFAPLAFLFPFLWLLRHRLWIAGLAAFAASACIALLTLRPQWALLGLPLNLLLGLFVGLEGPGWRIGAGTPLKAAMVPGRGLAAAEAPDFLFAAPGGANR